VNDALRAARISEQTARRARKRISVKRTAVPRHGPGSTWWLELR